MLKIGITGGIGSGKSTAAAIFNLLGIPVYYADIRAKQLMEENDSLVYSIKKTFGPNSYTGSKLNRDYLANAVFGQPDKLALLNSLVHPVTILDAANWMKSQHGPYALKEAALIFESGSEKQLDAVIGVSAPESVRVQRVMKRDGISYDAVTNRIAGQWDEAKKLNSCDYILINDEQSMLIPQVLQLHELLCKKAAMK